MVVCRFIFGRCKISSFFLIFPRKFRLQLKTSERRDRRAFLSRGEALLKSSGNAVSGVWSKSCTTADLIAVDWERAELRVADSLSRLLRRLRYTCSCSFSNSVSLSPAPLLVSFSRRATLTFGLHYTGRKNVMVSVHCAKSPFPDSNTYIRLFRWWGSSIFYWLHSDRLLWLYHFSMSLILCLQRLCGSMFVTCSMWITEWKVCSLVNTDVPATVHSLPPVRKISRHKIKHLPAQAPANTHFALVFFCRRRTDRDSPSRCGCKRANILQTVIIRIKRNQKNIALWHRMTDISEIRASHLHQFMPH